MSVVGESGQIIDQKTDLSGQIYCLPLKGVLIGVSFLAPPKAAKTQRLGIASAERLSLYEFSLNCRQRIPSSLLTKRRRYARTSLLVPVMGPSNTTSLRFFLLQKTSPFLGPKQLQTRPFHTRWPMQQTQRSPPPPPPPPTHPRYELESKPNFYRSHGRAFFKAITLAFLTYQIVYWAWLTLETEDIKDSKNREIKALENEVRLLDEGRRSHGLSAGGNDRYDSGESGKRILEEEQKDT